MIVGGHQIQRAVRAASRKEKGGSPEDARQEVTLMEAIAERHAGNKLAKSLYSVNSPDRNASLWLDDQIARAQTGVTTQVIELTPPLARVLLARNPDNRKLSEATIAKYARDIANGAWVFNGEPVILSKDGKLNDGQHRCEAVVAADSPIDVVLVIGTDRTSRFTVDQGKSRMAGDYLGMNGHHDPLALAAAASNVWQHREHGRLSQQQLHRPTKGEIIGVVEAHPDLAKSLSSIQSKGSDMVGGRGILAFCHWTFSRKASKADVDAFMAALINGENLGPNDPILYARNRLMAMRGRLRPNEKAELIFRAWNCHRRREKPKTLPILNGALPVVER